MKVVLRWQGSLAAQREHEEAVAKLPKRVKPVKASKKKRKRRRKKSKPVDYREYMQSKAWKSKRLAAIKYHGSKCAVCGSQRSLQVHHLTYERLGHERMTDLEVLCKGCHGLEHEDKHTPQDPLTLRFMATIG